MAPSGRCPASASAGAGSSRRYAPSSRSTAACGNSFLIRSTTKDGSSRAPDSSPTHQDTVRDVRGCASAA